MLQLGSDSEMLSLKLYLRDRSITFPLPDSEVIDTGIPSVTLLSSCESVDICRPSPELVKMGTHV